MSFSVRGLNVVRNTILTSPEGGMATPSGSRRLVTVRDPSAWPLLSGDYCLRTPKALASRTALLTRLHSLSTGLAYSKSGKPRPPHGVGLHSSSTRGQAAGRVGAGELILAPALLG